MKTLKLRSGTKIIIKERKANGYTLMSYRLQAKRRKS